MDRRRSMIVWLLVFGLIGVLSERIEASHAPGQAVKKSVPMKKDVGSKQLRNIGTGTRKNSPYGAQVRREWGMIRERDREQHERQRVQAMEAGQQAYHQRVRERLRQWAAGGRP